MFSFLKIAHFSKRINILEMSLVFHSVLNFHTGTYFKRLGYYRLKRIKGNNEMNIGCYLTSINKCKLVAWLNKASGVHASTIVSIAPPIK